MTDKQSFLDKLNAALIERGISDADIAPYLERFDRFYDRMVSDSVSTSRALENIDGIADNIAAQISDRYDEMNRLAERTMTMTAVNDKAEHDRSSAAPDSTAVPESKIGMSQAEAAVPDIDDQPTAEADIAEICEKAKAMETVSDDAVFISQTDITEAQPINSDIPAVSGDDVNNLTIPQRLPDYVEEEPLGNTRTFYIIFFATLPITAAIGLIGLAAFAGVWVILGAAIGALIAGLVGVAAAGATVSLVGIVYGIIRLFDKVSVGLYEIGLGVLAAGAALLTGILIYNFAIRFLPFVIKQVYRLFRFVIKKLKALFVYLRKECSKL